LFILRYDLEDWLFCVVQRAARSPCSCGFALPVDPSAGLLPIVYRFLAFRQPCVYPAMGLHRL